MLTKRDYEIALEIQDASNLIAVVGEFHRVLCTIMRETNSTESRNTHPIAVLYASKIASLTRLDSLETQAYSKVYDKIAYDNAAFKRDQFENRIEELKQKNNQN
jgi:hypothetical protein